MCLASEAQVIIIIIIIFVIIIIKLFDVLDNMLLGLLVTKSCIS